MKNKPKSKKREAASLLALIVRVTRLRAEIVELANDPRTDDLMKLCHYTNDNTSHQIGEMSIPISDLLDGATEAYVRLVSKSK